MLSIIIPTLNEAQNLARTLDAVRCGANGQAIETIVADCNSGDGTVRLALSLGASVVNGCPSRAGALNRGASIASGDVLLFLHADSIVPPNYPRCIARALADPAVVGGAFDFQFDRHNLPRGFARQALKLVMVLNRIRFRWTNNYYGDQGLFVRREVFRRIGGFPPVHLMEDVRFSRRLKHCGRTAILSPPIRTSPRRFLTRGVFRQMSSDLVLLACESLGIGPRGLWDGYNHWNRSEGGTAT